MSGKLQLHLDVNKIVQEYESGISISKLAEMYNVSHGTIRLRIKEHCKIRQTTDNVNLDLWIKDYESGLSTRSIASKYNINHHKITFHLKKKISLRERGLSTRKYSLKEDYFDSINTPEKAYILGFICADGNIVKKNSIAIGLKSSDKNILVSMAKELYLNNNYPIRYDEVNNYKKGTVSYRETLFMHSKKMHSKLIEYGISPAKSLTLKYPNVISSSTELIQKSFIRGYFDGDGCISGSKRKNSKSQSKDYGIHIVGTLDFCLSLKKIVEKFLPINSFIKHQKKICVWVVGGSQQAQKFCDWIYKDSLIHLDRKYKIYLDLVAQSKFLIEQKVIKKKRTLVSQSPSLNLFS